MSYLIKLAMMQDIDSANTKGNNPIDFYSCLKMPNLVIVFILNVIRFYAIA